MSVLSKANTREHTAKLDKLDRSPSQLTEMLLDVQGMFLVQVFTLAITICFE